MSFHRKALLTTCLVLAGIAPIAAQVRWSTAPMPKSGACFYENANFQGRYFCAAPGQSYSPLPADMRDKISSIRILGRAQVTAFSNERFRGPAARFNTDVRNLKNEGWNDAISSLRVENDALSWTEPALVWGNPRVPREGACFYSDPDYRGNYFCIPRGASYGLVPPGFNDKISSIRLMGADAILFVDRDFGGRAQAVRSSVPKLQGFWNDKISSIRVY